MTDQQRPPSLGNGLRGRLQDVFAAWGRHEHAAALEEDPALQRLFGELESQLEAAVGDDGSRPSDDTLAETYAVVGCARGLVDAMGQMQNAAGQINWNQWAESRF